MATEIQRLEEENREQNCGKFLFAIILYSILMQSYKYILNFNKNMRTYCTILGLKTANMKVADLETRIQRMEEKQTEQNSCELSFTNMIVSNSNRVLYISFKCQQKYVYLLYGFS